MSHGGKRAGSGQKPGASFKKTKLKPEPLKRVRKQVSLSAWVVEKLADKKNASEYILKLILADNPDWKPPTSR